MTEVATTREGVMRERREPGVWAEGMRVPLAWEGCLKIKAPDDNSHPVKEPRDWCPVLEGIVEHLS